MRAGKSGRRADSNPRNHRGLFFQWVFFALAGVAGLFSEPASAQEPAILGAASASNRAVVFPDANAPGTQSLVSGLPEGTQPHGVSYYGSDHALVAAIGGNRVHVVQVSTAALISTIPTAPSYNGSGTIAVAPDQSAALAVGNDSTLNVIHAPFGPASSITLVALPGEIKVFQTQAIVFNSAGRAFVYHTTGISVLDPPYNAIAFTIPVAFNPSSGAIAISPDGNTLLTTIVFGNQVEIWQGPFSDTSTSTNLTVPGGSALDGVMVAPNGLSAIVVSSGANHAAAITAPFSGSSVVETLPLPAGSGGFEDVGISADSLFAIITGNGGSSTGPPILIKAPFTAAGAVTSAVPITGVTNPGRGNGAVRFRPPLPTLKITSISRDTNNHILLQLSGMISGTPTIHASPDLSPDSFLSIGSAIANGPGTWQFDDADAATLSKRFYRATYP